MPLQRGEVQGYDFNRMVLEFTMLNQDKIIRCAISTAAPDDPNVRVLRVEPITAELWDGPSSAAGKAFEFAKARLTGAKPNVGENRKVTVAMR